MSMNATVNTNLSAVTDPVGNRGNIPNGVMPLPLTNSNVTVPRAITFGASDPTLNDPTIGSYTAALPASTGTLNNGYSQLVTITFSKAHGWSSLTHDLDIQLVGAANQTLSSVIGECSGGSFPGGNSVPNTSTTLTFMRQVGGIDTVTPTLAACTALITVRKRGVAHVPA
jgi:hypothetical protein